MVREGVEMKEENSQPIEVVRVGEKNVKQIKGTVGFGEK